MRIAILSCLDFSVPGGAERFFIDMAMALDATIVCLSYNPSLGDCYPLAKDVKFHALNVSLPNEPLKQVFGMRLFRSLKLDYDFFIATDDMALRFISNGRPHCYIMLTPRRALYDMYYQTIADLSLSKKLIYVPVLSLFRFLDRRFVMKNVSHIAGISHNVRNRIWRTYQRQAYVLYPPIHLENYHNRGYGDYWLSVSRIDKWKRVENLIEAFREMPDKKLKIAGKIYPSFKHLTSSAPPNVEFLGAVTDYDLITLYSNCRGFVTMAIDEDYGLTPLEAMACGKPVVAAKEGGYLETVVDGHTGLLVSPDPFSIRDAVCRIDKNPELYEKASWVQAARFDYKLFKEQISTYVHTLAGA
ncbi:MAG TPA: glycosyltransferase [Methanospirillum sp.]|uniref:glycosyltransferase n=1 Tax=Methanospirillum sp. TaxID=45200 RepID=UPI002C6EF1FC|nr:glycosyltransferase [Methanospirillum sp.]HWQ63164.1 glycosyltransferase [Methanospirillum sp.]